MENKVKVSEIINYIPDAGLYFLSKETQVDWNVKKLQGLKDISLKTLKKPINIERYLEPVDDEDGMEYYLKDI